jgi:uncharacterized protein (TIGR00369 family)
MSDDGGERSRTHTWTLPRAFAEGGEPGIALLRRMIAGEIPHPPISHTLGFFLAEVAEGEAVFTSRPEEFHYNPFGSVHGGYYAAILDSALGCAIMSELPPGAGFTTLEFKVNLVRPMYADTGDVRAVGHVVHRGSRLATAEARLEGVDGKLYAHANTTCMVFESWGQRDPRNGEDDRA